MKDLNKTVLITGASSGFGKSAAKLFAAHHWNVIATMRAPEKEEELTKVANVLVIRLDVQDTDSITNAIAAGIERFGKIDVLVNNAGYGVMGIFEAASKEQIRRQYEVNVFGLMDVTQAILPHFRKNKSGVIVNLSSFGGRVALPAGGLYNSTKFAVEGFSEALSYELSAINVSVKIVEPGSVLTNFAPSLEFITNPYPEYDELAKNVFARYRKTTEHIQKATADEVAETIYEAATDDLEQLRYIVGGDAEFYINAKANHSDEEYMKLLRGYFII